MTKFELQFKKFEGKTNKQVDRIIRGTALKMYGEIILSSPVDTGRFRANNMISIDNEKNYTVIEEDKQKIRYASQSQTFTKGALEINNQKIGKVIYIQNNLTYAKDLEYGSSKQAPTGIYRKTITAFSKFVTESVKE